MLLFDLSFYYTPLVLPITFQITYVVRLLKKNVDHFKFILKLFSNKVYSQIRYSMFYPHCQKELISLFKSHVWPDLI